MEKEQEKRYWGRLPQIMLCTLLTFVTVAYIYKKPIEITTAQCPSPIIQKTEEVFKMDDWQCEREGSQKEYDTDLLQPSGLWGNKKFDCWKLIMPIKQYCKMYECHENF